LEQWRDIVDIFQLAVNAAQASAITTAHQRILENKESPATNAALEKICENWRILSIDQLGSRARFDFICAISEWNGPLEAVFSGINLWLFQLHDANANPDKELIANDTIMSFREQWRSETWTFRPSRMTANELNSPGALSRQWKL
jgi:hypothetical protein